MKKCSTCQAEKVESDFYKDRSRPGGLAARCKPCESARQKPYFRERYYPAHVEELKAAVTERRRERKREQREQATSPKTLPPPTFMPKLKWLYLRDEHWPWRSDEWRERILALGAERTPGRRGIWRLPLTQQPALLALIEELPGSGS